MIPAILLALLALFFGVGLGLRGWADRRRADYLAPTLLRVNRALRDAGIDAFLDWGTLLGQHREDRLIRGDDDCDLGVREEDIDAVLDVLAELEGEGLGTYHHELQAKVWRQDWPNSHTDIYFYRPVDAGWRVLGRFDAPDGVLFPVSSVRFLAESFSAPAQPEERLRLLYGDDWRTPRDDDKGVFDAGDWSRSRAVLRRCVMTWREVLAIQRSPHGDTTAAAVLRDLLRPGRRWRP